jgi:prepilin-type N-terminal cleavage/methylation domain-containing protein
MNKSKRKLKGFTLLEMIVVIAIIAVMAAILVPSVSDYIRSNNIKSANAQAQQVFMAAQDYLVSEQKKGVKTDDITDGTSPTLCWIAVNTEGGSDSSAYDKTNRTTIVDSYGIKKSTNSTTDNNGYVSKTMSDGTVSYPIADGIESRMESGFKGSWVVAFYPKTFTVAYAVYNDYYKTVSETEAAVKLIGTNGGGANKAAAGRLYQSDFITDSSTTAKQVQEKDFINPDASEDAHVYTGQFPIRDFTADPI